MCVAGDQKATHFSAFFFFIRMLNEVFEENRERNASSHKSDISNPKSGRQKQKRSHSLQVLSAVTRTWVGLARCNAAWVDGTTVSC